MNTENKVKVSVNKDYEIDFGVVVEGFYDYGDTVLGTPEDPKPVFKVVVKADASSRATCPFCGSYEGCDQFYTRSGVPGFPGIEDYVTYGAYIDPATLGLVS